jgi:glycosyltransferase involved in cell wall biosynthesis
MIKQNKKLVNKLTLIFDFFGALIINFCYALLRRDKNHKKDYILGYAPYKDNPWILNKIFFDLKSSSNKSENYKVFYSLISLSIFRLKNGGNVFSMHQSNIKKLFLAGFKLSEISTYYTHTRINQKGIKNISKLKNIFCQNNYEYALLKSCDIPEEKIISFPVGLHEKFLVKNDYLNNIKDREFDVLFCLRYIMNNNHYSSRKRYNFIIQLSNMLAKSNFKVCIMGDGWNQIRSNISKEIFLVNPPYKDYGFIYRNSKIYCNPSLVEGGPLSLVEAFSSGCIIFTTPVGLSFNLCVDDDFSFLIPFEKEENYWKKNIIKLLSKNKKDLIINLKSRNKKIQKSLFKNLSKKLEENLL